VAVLKAMTSGGARRPLDFFPTPAEATLALLPLIKRWPKEILEPCCGDGAISKVLAAAHYDVLSADIADYGYSHADNDFFELRATTRSIVTNPPFGRAADFIRHADVIGAQRMALLLKVNFWSAASRFSLFSQWRPYLIAPLTWRLDFTGTGAPHTDCMWCLWDRASRGTGFEPLARDRTTNFEIPAQQE
jgi:hypothetical protein